MNHPDRTPALTLLSHPYEGLTPVTGGREQLRLQGRAPGSCLVWHLQAGAHEQDANVVRRRPGGLPVIVVLPELPAGLNDPALVRAVDSVRPAAVLPHHASLDMDELTTVLRRPPENLGVEVTDYLQWRGLGVDRETTQLIRRTLSLSADLRSITGLCRSMYLSRRALGRRFLSRGLPVASHWLHFGRLLRVAIRLQNSDENVLSIGYELGYPDAFALSNQMVRLTGYRPSDARRFLGWEWLIESWLRREADAGGLAPDFTVSLLAEGRPARAADRRAAPLDPMHRPSARRPSSPNRAAG